MKQVNDKSVNQYYGKYRECCVVACLNDTPVEYNENYNFSLQERYQMLKQGEKVANYIGNHTAYYTGNHTVISNGDLILDNGDSVELKFVSAGTGTYFNTSVYYFLKFGFDFKEYMEKYGLYDTLSQKFSISKTNNSPVSAKISSEIRHSYKEFYETNIVPIDEIVRQHFIQDLYDYFQLHIDDLYVFLMDMLNKNSLTSKKQAPDRLIIFNYLTNTIKEINLKNFKNCNLNNFKITPKGLVIDSVRVAISWQNGVGLNNPTIRIFLSEA